MDEEGGAAWRRLTTYRSDEEEEADHEEDDEEEVFVGPHTWAELETEGLLARGGEGAGEPASSGSGEADDDTDATLVSITGSLAAAELCDPLTGEPLRGHQVDACVASSPPSGFGLRRNPPLRSV